MELSILFPNEPKDLQIKDVVLGKTESDDTCSCFEKYSYIELESDNLIINTWRGSCCCLIGCCYSCVDFNFISKITCFFRWFYCYKKITIKKEKVVDIGYIFSGIRINEEWKYWPVLALDNKQLILIGSAQELYEVKDRIIDLRNKLSIQKNSFYEIPNIYLNNLI